MPSNPNIVFCDFDGNTFFIKENKVWKMDNNYEISLNSVKIDSVFNLPYSINIKTGTLQNKNLVILTHENNVIEYDLIEREIVSNTSVNDYFQNVEENIECMLFCFRECKSWIQSLLNQF